MDKSIFVAVNKRLKNLLISIIKKRNIVPQLFVDPVPINRDDPPDIIGMLTPLS